MKRSDMTMIRIRALNRHYTLGGQQIRAVDGVDLDIHEGESVALLGPSGSGKSTLMHLLGALDTPTSGSIEVEGKEIGRFNSNDAARYRSHNIGFVFQSFHLQAQLTALENVALPLKLSSWSKAKREERAKELLELVGLGDRLDHNPSQLSGGQQQRVSIARALANHPRILLADEPTGNLDSHTGAEVMELFHKLQSDCGLTLIVVTHDADVAAQLGRVVRLRDGAIESMEGEIPEAAPVLPTGSFERPKASVLAKLFDTCSDVVLNFRRHPLRTGLTSFGIAVGGMAIILMVGLGFGLHDFIETQAESINDPLSLWVINSETSIQDIVGSRAQQLGRTPEPLKEKSLEVISQARGGFQAFNDDQIKVIQGIPGVTSVRPRTYVVMDGLRLLDKGEETLNTARATQSDRFGDPDSFSETFYIGYTLVRGYGTKFRMEEGRPFTAEDVRAVVVSYQYAEAWKLTPRELLGREVEIIFPELSNYGQFTWAVPQDVKARYGGYRARIIGVTKKSILSSAVYLSPGFGEEVTRFQFGKRQPGEGGPLSFVSKIRDLSLMARDKALIEALKKGSDDEVALAQLLFMLQRMGANTGKQGSQGALMLMAGLGRLRTLVSKESLMEGLRQGGEQQKRLAVTLAGFADTTAKPQRAPTGKSKAWGSRIRVRVASKKDLPGVMSSLKENGFRVRSLQDNLTALSRVFGVIDAFLSSFGVIALFVAALGIANTLIMAVYERTSEIGVMKAVGASQGQIQGLFALEAAAIGLLGGFLGAGIGMGLGEAINRWGVTIIAEDWAGFEFFTAPFSLLVATIIFCVLIGFLAGLYPAYRASRLDPIVALRSD
jgi:putative ABC transport system ATP-binding protein